MSKSLGSWKTDLKSGLETGTLNNDSTEPYVQLIYTDLHVLFSEEKQPVLLLMMIHVPPALRHQGLATQIVAFLEKRAAREKMRLAIGPIMEVENGIAYMDTICSHRGYGPVIPWCRMQLLDTDRFKYIPSIIVPPGAIKNSPADSD